MQRWKCTMVSYIWQWKIIQDGEEKQKGKGGSVLQVLIQPSPALSS
jgi:hypothetical protein